MLTLADDLAVDHDIFDCLAQSDEVHVMTSLAGFEALLQGKTVHTWGCPFYAGWSLTIDHCQPERRGVSRSIDELLYLAYVRYSRYINWKTRCFTTAERMLRTLQDEDPAESEGGPLVRWCARKRRKLGYLVEALRA